MSINKFMDFKKLFTQVKNTGIRFPLPVLSILIFAANMLNETHNFYKLEDDIALKISIFSGLGFFYFTAIKIFLENHDMVSLRQYIVTSIIYAILTYVLWNNFNYNMFFISGAIVLFALFSPFLDRETDQDSVWYHAYLICYNCVFGVIGGVAIGLGLSAILASSKYLFGIGVNSKAFSDIWIFSMFIFTPIFILANFSSKFEFEKQECGTPFGIYFLEKYIFIPLILVYMAILYLYLGKIIINWELPKGNLGYMIMGFGIIGTILHMIVYPLSNSDNKTISTFYDNFYKMLFIPLIMLFVAIFTRIGEYGMTEQRYAVVICGLWLLIISVYYLCLKERFHIKHIPTVLVILLVFAAVGPVNAHKMSEHSQVQRLKDVLKENNLYERGRALKASDDDKISFKTRKELSSIFDYLTRTNKEDKLDILFKNIEIKRGKGEEKDKKNKYQEGRILMSSLNLKYVSSWQRDDSYFNQDHHYYRNIKDDLYFDVKKYDHMFLFKLNSGLSEIYNDQKVKINLNIDRNAILINDDLELNLSDLIKKLKLKPSYQGLNKEEEKIFKILIQKDNKEALLHIESIGLKYIDDKSQISYIHGMLFYKE